MYEGVSQSAVLRAVTRHHYSQNHSVYKNLKSFVHVYNQPIQRSASIEITAQCAVHWSGLMFPVLWKLERSLTSIRHNSEGDVAHDGSVIQN